MNYRVGITLFRKEFSRVENAPLSFFTKIIIVEKFIKGFFLEILSISIFPIFSDEMIVFLHTIADRSHFFSTVRVINYFLSRVESASDRRLETYSFLFFLWGILEISESLGLYKKRRWAEYLAVVGTGFFIPIEIYSLTMHITIEKFGILVFNCVLVIYLIWIHKLFFIDESRHH